MKLTFSRAVVFAFFVLLAVAFYLTTRYAVFFQGRSNFQIAVLWIYFAFAVIAVIIILWAAMTIRSILKNKKTKSELITTIFEKK